MSSVEIATGFVKTDSIDLWTGKLEESESDVPMFKAILDTNLRIVQLNWLDKRYVTLDAIGRYHADLMFMDNGDAFLPYETAKEIIENFPGILIDSSWHTVDINENVEIEQIHMKDGSILIAVKPIYPICDELNDCPVVVDAEGNGWILEEFIDTIVSKFEWISSD